MRAMTAISHSLVVDDAAALERVALHEMPECALMVAEIGIGFAERKMQSDLLLLFERADIARQILHGLQLRVAGRKVLGHSEPTMHAGA